MRDPPQVLVAFGIAAITNPGGNASVSGMLRLTSTPFGLPSMIVSALDVPAAIDAGLNCFVSVGGSSTCSVASAGKVLLPALVCNAPVGMSFA